MTLLGWNTSLGSNGKAHFYVEGKPSCGDRKGIYPGGVTLGELFTRPTRPTETDDHLCTYCAKVVLERYQEERARCTCWSCQAKRRGAKRP